jgi:hypothetical protein
MRPFTRLFKAFSILVIAALACQCGGVTPTPVPTLPAATPTPLPPVQPVVADHFPNKGDELAIDGSIDVYFDQAMDQASVQTAFSLSPDVKGTFTWLDAATVRFTPTTPFERATRYTVTIGTGAKSAAGIILKDPFTFTADTIGFLEVTQVLPAPDTQGVEVGAAITVMFNRPVVPLGLTTDAANNANLPDPLVLNPPVAGKGEWLNTSIYVFRPETALAGSTTYQASIKAGLTSTAGSLLATDYSWSFSTLPPDVVNVNPVNESANVPLDTQLSVTFNQPMDRASTEQAFQVFSGDQTVTGQIEWTEDGMGFTFTPSQLLSYALHYTVRFQPGAKAIDGQTPLTTEFTSMFTTVAAPGILLTDPSDGSTTNPFNGVRISFVSPMDQKTLKDNISISPEAEITYDYYSDYDFSYYLSFNLQPSTDYTLTLGGDMADPYGVKIGDSMIIHFRTGPYDPIFQFNTRGDVGVYRADLPTSLYVTYRNLSQMHFELYRMTLDDFARWTGPNGYEFQQSYQPADQLRDWNLNVEAFPNENAFVKVELTEDNSPLAPGVYFLKGQALDVPTDYYRGNHILVVSKYNLSLKVTFGEALVWATDQVTGQPVSGLPISIRDQGFTPVASGTTDANGLYRAQLPDTLPDLWTNVYALTNEGSDFVIASSGWSSGIDTYEFNLNANYYPPAGTVYLYTDRPVYRPGQEVSFRGIVRTEKDARFALPDLKNISVSITNDQGEDVYSQVLTLDEFGAFSDQFTLADAASTGYYSINVETGEAGNFQSYLGFLVAEYHKPEFLVNVTTDQPEVVQGSTIHATVESTFYFGGAVSNAEVSWTLLTANSFFQYDGPGYYDFSDFDYTSGAGTPYYGTFGEVIASGTGKTDSQGKLKLDIPADIGKRTTSQIFTLEATVTDVSGQPVSGRTEIKVHQGDFYLGIGPDQFVGEAGKESRFNLISVDWQGDPSPNHAVEVTFYEHDWKCAQEEDEFGNQVWGCTAKDTEAAKDSVTTDGNGKAITGFTPQSGGTYKVVAVAKDSSGHEIRAASYIWVVSAQFVSWRQENNNRINLVPDRKLYHPGDTASILIPSPFQGATKALVTVERGGFYKVEVLDLTSNSTLYQLPITPDYAPDVYVSVIIIKGVDDTNPAPAFRMGLAHLKVSPEQQEITVTLTPDKTKVGPRDTVTYNVKATDFAGKPVQAEFSLALADLSALALAAPNSSPIVQSFYGERGLSVRTAVGLTLSVDQLNIETAIQKGGGGGGAEEGFLEVRGDFRDTAYWNATVVTDANGEASVDITLPDNLTTWRLDARGVTKDTLVGQSTVDIVATKDLLIRPVTPRFFVVGDKAQLAAVINNNTNSALSVDVTLSGTGIALADSTPGKQTINVPANDRARVEWTVTIADQPFADLTFSAVGGGFSDASKPTLGTPPDQHIPILKYSAPETVGTAGELDGQANLTELIALPKRYDVTQGELNVEINPSLAAGMISGLDYLEHYPYECTEQTLSRFLPNVLTYRALKNLGVNDPALEQRLTALVGQGTQKLYARQHADGGWGWWTTDESNPFITAYALFGLHQAAQAGFTVEDSALANAASYLANVLTTLPAEETWQLNRRAFILYALADYGQGDVSETTQLYEKRARLDTYARAYLAMTLAIFDKNDTRLATLLSDINNAAIVSATGAHWEEESRDYWNMNTDTRSTAIVLSALAKLDPENNLNPNVVRWLMVARQANGGWESTQETAWALIGLTDWMSATGELKANYTYSVSLNGNSLTTGNATPDNVREPVELQVKVADLIKDQANRLVFDRGAGDGRMYYTAHLTVYQNVPEIKALNKGLVVARQYTIPDGKCGTKGNPVCPAVTAAKVGDNIQVRVTIIAPNDLYYVVIEDPIPAGTEPVDTSLLTTSVVGQPPTLNYEDPFYYGWGWWWFSNTDLRDEKVVLSATFLPKGTYEYTYTLHASLAGSYNVIPTNGYEFYFPEVSGRGDGMLFTIEP